MCVGVGGWAVGIGGKGGGEHSSWREQVGRSPSEGAAVLDKNEKDGSEVGGIMGLILRTGIFLSAMGPFGELGEKK